MSDLSAVIARDIVESAFPSVKYDEVPKKYNGGSEKVTKGAIQCFVQEGIDKALKRTMFNRRVSFDEALAIVVDRLKTDYGYRRIWWHAISISFQEIDNKHGLIWPTKKVGDKAAEDFIRLLCDNGLVLGKIIDNYKNYCFTDLSSLDSLDVGMIVQYVERNNAPLAWEWKVVDKTFINNLKTNGGLEWVRVPSFEKKR